VKSSFEACISVNNDAIDKEWWRVLSVRISGFMSGMEWWRVLSLRISGFMSGMTRTGSDFHQLRIQLISTLSPGRCVVTLNYSDDTLLRAVVRDIIGSIGDTEKWDKVEEAYWME
jgi:hypothetical protein